MALFLWHGALCLAGGLEAVLVAPATAPRPGQRAVFAVYWHNWEEEAIRVDPPRTMACRLRCAGQTVETTADGAGPGATGPVEVPPKSFVRRDYVLAVPEFFKNAVQLEVPDLDGSRLMFALAEDGASTPEPSPGDKREKEEYATLDSLFALYQPYLGNIGAYRPMYFLVGADPKDSKFQVSLKYRFLNPDTELARRHPWLRGFHFAYTQTSFWDLASASMPFQDTSYKPEIFFLSSNIDTGGFRITRCFVQGGFQHESNGRDEPESRSTNFAYLNPMLFFYDEESRLGLQVSPKVWAYVMNDEKTNPDLEDYRGYFDLGLKVGKADSFVLGSHFRWAREGGSMQVDLTYPLNRYVFKDFDVYLQAEYVNTLAESLLNYTRRTESFRIGCAIVR